MKLRFLLFVLRNVIYEMGTDRYLENVRDGISFVSFVATEQKKPIANE